jgi:hypothetical protein
VAGFLQVAAGSVTGLGSGPRRGRVRSEIMLDMWRQHLTGLFKQSWRLALSLGSSTNVSVFALTLGAIVLGFALTVGIEWHKGGHSKAALKAALRSWPAYAVAMIAFFIPWTCVFLWAMGSTIYQDHLSLVERNNGLTNKLHDRDEEIANLHHQLATKLTAEHLKTTYHPTATRQVVQPPVQNCPGGICVGRDNNAPATVINGLKQRQLSSLEKQQLINGLSKVPGKVLVAGIVFDPEAAQYAEQIEDAFRQAKWELLRDPRSTGVLCPQRSDPRVWDCFGFQIITRGDFFKGEFQSAEGKEVVDAFTSAGFGGIPVTLDMTEGEHAVAVVIGKQPPPP